MSSEALGLLPSCPCPPNELGVKEPGARGRVRLSGLFNLSESLCGGVPYLGGDCPNELLSACEREDVPGPGAEPAVAPASGSCLEGESCRGGVRGPLAGEPWMGVASRAVAEAREGEPERPDSVR